jgi:hypothetical protein
MEDDLERALNWEPDKDFYGNNFEHDKDPAEFWKPKGYKVLEWEDQHELEERTKKEEINKKYKSQCLKAMVVCGVGAIAVAVPLFYIIASHIAKDGLYWPF